jgi:radical SAM protein with 4Fe4S-binding SPASM domain
MISLIGERSSLSLNELVRFMAEIYEAPHELIAIDVRNFTRMLFENDILENSDKSEVVASFSNSEKIKDNEQDVEEQMMIVVGENKILSKALLELTYRCNLKCVHCYAIGSSNTEQELSTKEWFGILDQLADANVLNIVFTGGEVFVRKDFLDIFDYAIKKRFLIDIYSNGAFITKEQINHLSSRYINSFQTSIYGDTAEIHDNITGIKGSFDKTFATLKRFKELGVSLVIRTIMMKQNSESCLGMRKIADELGAEFQIGLSISQANNGDISPKTLRIESPELMKKLLFERDKELININHPQKDLERSLCGAGFNGISITPSGKVLICNAIDISIGDCKHENIVDIWNHSAKLKSFREKRVSDMKKCVDCAYLDYCQFCPGVALQDVGSLTDAYDEACFIAKMRYEVLKQ